MHNNSMENKTDEKEFEIMREITKLNTTLEQIIKNENINTIKEVSESFADLIKKSEALRKKCFAFKKYNIEDTKEEDTKILNALNNQLTVVFKQNEVMTELARRGVLPYNYLNKQKELNNYINQKFYNESNECEKKVDETLQNVRKVSAKQYEKKYNKFVEYINNTEERDFVTSKVNKEGNLVKETIKTRVPKENLRNEMLKGFDESGERAKLENQLSMQVNEMSNKEKRDYLKEKGVGNLFSRMFNLDKLSNQFPKLNAPSIENQLAELKENYTQKRFDKYTQDAVNGIANYMDTNTFINKARRIMDVHKQYSVESNLNGEKMKFASSVDANEYEDAMNEYLLGGVLNDKQKKLLNLL